MGLKIECYSAIDIGLKRQSNQDSLLVDKKNHIFALADGLGGHVAGEVASSMALDSLYISIKEDMQQLSADTDTAKLRAVIHKAFEKANEEVFVQSMQHTSLRGMGTTVVMAWIYNSQVMIGHVGDSRAYLYRDQHLWQLTDDHSLSVNESKLGFSYQDKLTQQKRGHLIQSVGLSSKLNIDISTRDAIEGDTYLLCSDGLHGMVPDATILNVFRSEELSDVSRKCMIKALSAGGWDNISIIVIKVTSF